MEEARAKFRFIRMSPRKVRVVMDLVRGKNVEEAENILKFTRRRAAEVVYKLLLSAVDNAIKDKKLDKEKLYIKEIYADPGPIMKRIMPKAYGRAGLMRRRTTHATIVLAER
jgi:large subunit ribosomal protein L22